MGFNDVYSAWQLGTIDGCEGTLTHMITTKYYELTKTAALVGYMYMPGVSSCPTSSGAPFRPKTKPLYRRGEEGQPVSYDNQRSLDAEK